MKFWPKALIDVRAAAAYNLLPSAEDPTVVQTSAPACKFAAKEAPPLTLV
jgi:hypothetical protein